MLINSCFFFLISYHFLVINVLIFTVTGWRLEEELAVRVKAACEDEDVINPLHSSSSAASVSSEGNSRNIVQASSKTECRYPAAKIYKGWRPPSLSTVYFVPISHPLRSRRQWAFWVVAVLEHLYDIEASPVERLANFPKIQRLVGRNTGELFLEGSQLSSYLFFKKLWLASQGSEKVSPDLEMIVLNYLSRDRAKPLSPELVEGLKPFLRSSNSFENELAHRLRSHIYKEDLVLKSALISHPEYDSTLELGLSLHHYWTPVHDPRIEKHAYVEEIIEHLKDFRRSLWDRVNSYEMLERRITPSDPHEPPNDDYDEEMKRYFFWKMKNLDNEDVVLHSRLAKHISRITWPADPASQRLRKIGQQLHALDRSREIAIVELRKTIETTAKDTSLDLPRMMRLNGFLQIVLMEHYPNEEMAARRVITNNLKRDERWSTDNEYRKIVKDFRDGKFSIINTCVEMLISSDQALQISPRFVENILDIIRHISKYDFEERAWLRHKLQLFGAPPRRPGPNRKADLSKALRRTRSV